MKAWIYFARFGVRGPIKIGRAFNPQQRMKMLACGSPFVLVLLGAVLSERAKEEEREIQKRLRSHCVRGEWFEREAALREMRRLGERVVAPEDLEQQNSPRRRTVEPRDRQFTVRIPQRIRDEMAVQADRERRTVADVFNNILEEHVAAREGCRR